MRFPRVKRLSKIFLAAATGLAATVAGRRYVPRENHPPAPETQILFPNHINDTPDENPPPYPDNITEDIEKTWNRIVAPPENWSGDLYFINPETNSLIRCAHAPATGEKKGTVILTCGYNEFPELFFETIKNYQDMGLEVWTMDWHGFGRSGRDHPDEPQKTSLRSFDQHVSDLGYFIDRVAMPDENLPLIYSANSMGGHFGMLYMEEHPDKFDAAILGTPMLDISRRGYSKIFRPVISGIFNALSYAGYDNTDVPYHGMYEEKDPDHDGTKGLYDPALTEENIRTKAKDYIQSKYANLMLGPPSFGWLTIAMDSAAKLLDKDNLGAIQTYVLIGNAEKDNLVEVTANKFAAKQLPNGKLVVPDGAAHGLWFQSGKALGEWTDAVRRIIEHVLDRHSPANDNNHDQDNRPPAAGSAPGISYG